MEATTKKGKNKTVIVIVVIAIVLLVGLGLYFMLRRPKSPEEVEADVIAALIEKQKALNKEVEAANAGKTIEETGGRTGAYRMSTSMSKEEWNEQLAGQIRAYETLIASYQSQIDAIVKRSEAYVRVYGLSNAYNLNVYKSMIESRVPIDGYIAVAREAIAKLKSQML